MRGRRLPTVHTDLANATSHAIYSRTGYLPVCDAGLYALNREAA